MLTLKRKIERILEEAENGLRDVRGIDPRNSDIALTILVWKIFYGVGDTIRLEQFYNLPSQDGVKRIRAFFNAKMKHWPTDIKIVKARGLNEDKWREQLGYPIKSETIYPTKQESYTTLVQVEPEKSIKPPTLL